MDKLSARALREAATWHENHADALKRANDHGSPALKAMAESHQQIARDLLIKAEIQAERELQP